MTLRVTCRLCEDHTLKEVEKQLKNTSYLVHAQHRCIFATYDFDPNHLIDERYKSDKKRLVELDLLYLGLLTENSYVEEII